MKGLKADKYMQIYNATALDFEYCISGGFLKTGHSEIQILTFISIRALYVMVI